MILKILINSVYKHSNRLVDSSFPVNLIYSISSCSDLIILHRMLFFILMHRFNLSDSQSSKILKL